MDFWPDEIHRHGIRTPTAIMEEAGDELTRRTDKLIAAVHVNHLEDRVVLAFEIRNCETQRVLNLFEVHHRLNDPYPVVINPPAGDIPEFLARKRYVPAKPSISAIAEQVALGKPAKYVENEWVCATPSEFSRKLKELFAKDFILVRVINLLTPTDADEATANEQGNEGGSSADGGPQEGRD